MHMHPDNITAADRKWLRYYITSTTSPIIIILYAKDKAPRWCNDVWYESHNNRFKPVVFKSKFPDRVQQMTTINLTLPTVIGHREELVLVLSAQKQQQQNQLLPRRLTPPSFWLYGWLHTDLFKACHGSDFLPEMKQQNQLTGMEKKGKTKQQLHFKEGTHKEGQRANTKRGFQHVF